ncbi:MAG: TadE/TadG family type IV pilus assembly protein [Methyloligellaceae bacterium]
MDRQPDKACHYTKTPWQLLLRKFSKNRSGATAVEFGFVALPFLMLLFAIIEVALVFFGTLALDNAVEQTGRLVRTGQAQASSMSASAFKDNICDQVVSIFDCESKLQVELITFSNFQAASDYASNAGNDPINSSGDLRDDFTYNASSAAEEIVLLRVYFEWDLTLAFPGIGLANMGNGNRLLTAVTAFKNEPFD